MPQLDLSTYFMEYFIFLFFFFILYVIGLVGFFPRLIRVLLIRKFLLNTLLSEFFSFYFILNQLYLWSSFLAGYWIFSILSSSKNYIIIKEKLNISFNFFFQLFNSFLFFFFS
jgi:hypothetical protein